MRRSDVATSRVARRVAHDAELLDDLHRVARVLVANLTGFGILSARRLQFREVVETSALEVRRVSEGEAEIFSAQQNPAKLFLLLRDIFLRVSARRVVLAGALNARDKRLAALKVAKLFRAFYAVAVNRHAQVDILVLIAQAAANRRPFIWKSVNYQ